MVLFAAIAWGVCTAVVTVMAGLLWAGSSKVEDRVRTAFGTALTNDKEMARAMVRGFPMICLASWGIALSGFAISLEGARSVSQSGEFPVFAMALTGAGLLFIGVLLDVFIIHFNRPKSLIPPHLRWEPGYRDIERARANASRANVSAEVAVEALYEECANREGQECGNDYPPREKT